MANSLGDRGGRPSLDKPVIVDGERVRLNKWQNLDEMERKMAEQPEQIQIQVTWEGLDALPTMASNTFLVQQTPHEFVLSFGFVTPPMFTKAPTREELSQIKALPAKPIVRLSMSPGRLVELLGLIQQQLAAYQQAQKQ